MNPQTKPLADVMDKMADAQVVASRNDAEARADSAAEAAAVAGPEEHANEYGRLRQELLDGLDAEHAVLLSRHAVAGPTQAGAALALLQEFRVRRGEIERELVVLDGIAALRGAR